MAGQYLCELQNLGKSSEMESPMYDKLNYHALQKNMESQKDLN